MNDRTGGRPKSVYMPVRIEPQLYDEVERIANESDTTISAVVREAVRQFLESYGAL